VPAIVRSTTAQSRFSPFRHRTGIVKFSRSFTFALIILHAFEYESGTVKEIVPNRAGRDLRFEGLKANRAAMAVQEHEPLRSGCEEVALRRRHFWNNLERMRHDRYRDQGIPVGYGFAETGCRMFGLRLKRPGAGGWSKRRASAMPALGCCVANCRMPDVLGCWQARRAVGA